MASWVWDVRFYPQAIRPHFNISNPISSSMMSRETIIIGIILLSAVPQKSTFVVRGFSLIGVRGMAGKYCWEEGGLDLNYGDIFKLMAVTGGQDKIKKIDKI